MRPSKASEEEQQSALRLRLLPPLHPDVRRTSCSKSASTISMQVFDGRKKKVKAKLDTDLTAEDLQAIIVDYKKLVQKKTGKPFPQEAVVQLAMARDAVFRSWLNDARQALPPDGKHSRRPRHRRQRAGHGVRQHGRNFRHRRGLHPQPVHRRKGVLRRVPGERAGRRRGGRHPHAAAHRRARTT